MELEIFLILAGVAALLIAVWAKHTIRKSDNLYKSA